MIELEINIFNIYNTLKVLKLIVNAPITPFSLKNGTNSNKI